MSSDDFDEVWLNHEKPWKDSTSLFSFAPSLAEENSWAEFALVYDAEEAKENRKKAWNNSSYQSEGILREFESIAKTLASDPRDSIILGSSDSPLMKLAEELERKELTKRLATMVKKI